MRSLTTTECAFVAGGQDDEATQVDDVVITGKRKKEQVWFGGYTYWITYFEVGAGGNDIWIGAGFGWGQGPSISVEDVSDVETGIVVQPDHANARIGVADWLRTMGQNASDMYNDFLDDTGIGEHVPNQYMPR